MVVLQLRGKREREEMERREKEVGRRGEGKKRKENQSRCKCPDLLQSAVELCKLIRTAECSNLLLSKTVRG